MTISRSVYNQLFEQSDSQNERVIRLRPTEAKAGAVVVSAKNKIQMWTKEEHERFLVALEMYPAGPWKKVADYIGTKTPRQTMTHAQKYRQKIHRRQRGLRNQKKGSPTSAPSSPVPIEPAKLKQEGPENRLLDILAHQATAMQQQRPAAVPAPVTLAPSAPAQLSPSSHLPSLAEILHLRGSATSPASSSPKQDACSCNCRCSAHAPASVGPLEAPRPAAQRS
jgi:SHAQKYF class myb-like DNA-binding protein